MAIVTVDDLVAYMSGVSLSDDQRTLAAPLVLDGVQQQLEVWLNRPVQPVLVREIGLSDYDRRLWTTVTPIHAVADVTAVDEVEGTALIPATTPALEEVDLADFRALTDSTAYGTGQTATTTLRRMDTRPGAAYILCDYADTYYQVEYVGGYDGFADDALKLAILRVAAREMTENHDDTLSIKADFAKDAAPPVAKGWQPDELAALRRLKRRVVAWPR